MTEKAIATLTEIVRTATRAPSMNNTQPWRLCISPSVGRSIAGAVIEVRMDRSRELPVADPSGWAVRVACGAVTLGVSLGVAVRGHHRPLVNVRPDAADADLVARVLVAERRLPTPREKELYAAIRRRRSNRRPFHPVPPPRGTGLRLGSDAHAEGAWLAVCDNTRTRAAVAAVVREAQRTLDSDPARRAEFADWVRDAADDGMPAVTGGPSPAPYDLLAFPDFGNPQRAPGRDFEPDPLVCVLGTDSDRPAAQVRAGMALHRVLLAATQAGLDSSMLSQPIELPQFRGRLRHALGRSGGWPQMVLRFGYGTRTPATPRRPVDEVLEVAVAPVLSSVAS